MYKYLLLFLLLVGCTKKIKSEPDTFFIHPSVQKIILTYKCNKCHSVKKPKGKLNLVNWTYKGRPFDKNNAKRLLDRISRKGKGQMPPKGPRMNSNHVKFIQQWVRGQQK